MVKLSQPNMYREHVKIFCIVAGALVLVLSGRDVEAGVPRNEPESSNDGLRADSEHLAIDTSDLEERNTESSIVDGFHKIPRQFELPLPDVDPESETTEPNYEEFPAPEESEKPISLFNYQPKEGEDDKFLFLGDYHNKHSSTAEKSKIKEEHHTVDEIGRHRLRELAAGNEEGFPFRDGLRRKPQSDEKFDDSKVKDFQTTNEEYPFINGLRRFSRSTGKSENSLDVANVENSRSLVDDLPLINRLRLCSFSKSFPFVDCRSLNQTAQINESKSNDEDFEEFPVIDEISKKDAHPIKKRDTLPPEDDEDDYVEDEFPFISKKRMLPEDWNNDTKHMTKVHLFPTTKPRPPGYIPLRYMVSFGEEYANQSCILERVARKPIPAPAYFKRLITHETFPSRGKNNSCPINYILIRNLRKYDSLYSDHIKVVSGGLGETYVTLRITSYNTYLYKYLIFIYGLCAEHQDWPNMKEYHSDQIWTPDA